MRGWYQMVSGKRGEYLATMSGYFQGDQRYSLVLVESTDGIDWKFRSLICRTITIHGTPTSRSPRAGPRLTQKLSRWMITP